jgi:hypothetical protein
MELAEKLLYDIRNKKESNKAAANKRRENIIFLEDYIKNIV